MILGRSKIKRRVYVDSAGSAEAVKAMAEGWEVVEIGRPYFLYLQSDRGRCSTPYNNFTAKHCVSEITKPAAGKTALVVTRSVVYSVRVVKDPNGGFLSNVLRFFRQAFCAAYKDYVVLDRSEVEKDREMIAVLSAGNSKYSFIIATPVVGRPQAYIGRGVVAYPDFPHEAVISGEVDDYGVFWIFDGATTVKVEGLFVRTDRPAVPGNSGSAVWLR
jgi:hypothetical protein